MDKVEVVFHGIVEVEGRLLDCDCFNYFDYYELVEWLVAQGIDG